MSKTVKTRIQQKHDLEANWITADKNGFVPLRGELIIYDTDNNYNYERFKIGDGVTTVQNLPFANAPKHLDSNVDIQDGELVLKQKGEYVGKIINDVFVFDIEGNLNASISDGELTIDQKTSEYSAVIENNELKLI